MSSSPQLHDEGEESWTLKIHVGCGGIYLRGYINVDVSGEQSLQRTDLVVANIADVSDYYARLDGDMGSIPTPRQTVADLICNAASLPYTPRTVDKILAIQMFEHLSPASASVALAHWRSLLHSDCPLVLTVPDTLATLELMKTDMAFAMRHMLGSNRNPHLAWYTKETLTELLELNGFSVTHIDNPHFYPAICVRAIKR